MRSEPYFITERGMIDCILSDVNVFGDENRTDIITFKSKMSDTVKNTIINANNKKKNIQTNIEMIDNEIVLIVITADDYTRITELKELIDNKIDESNSFFKETDMQLDEINKILTYEYKKLLKQHIK